MTVAILVQWVNGAPAQILCVTENLETAERIKLLYPKEIQRDIEIDEHVVIEINSDPAWNMKHKLV